MPPIVNIQASIVNEGTSEIERLAAKITQVSGQNDEFIKTYPFFEDRANRSTMLLLKEDLKKYTKLPQIGISFKSYGYFNYVEFTSEMKHFPLNGADQIVFIFDNEEEMTFTFGSGAKPFGKFFRNLSLITDDQLQFLADNTMISWQLVNNESGLTIMGGFKSEDENKQYKSSKTGQKLFKVMAHKILSIKSGLAS